MTTNLKVFVRMRMPKQKKHLCLVIRRGKGVPVKGVPVHLPRNALMLYRVTRPAGFYERSGAHVATDNSKGDGLMVVFSDDRERSERAAPIMF